MTDGKGAGSADRTPLGPGREFDLIRTLAGSVGGDHPEVEVGSGDDAAVLAGGLVVSVDLTVEGVHFRRDWITLAEAGYRAAAAALSDLAAMAAEPLGLLLSVAVLPAEAETALPELQRGAAAACRREGIGILGGDLARSPGPLFLDVAVLGRTGTPLRRAGAHPGDEVWVTGTLGDSAGAVAAWQRGGAPPEPLREAFAAPKPRIREALWLAERAPLHAGIDLSDGLSGDAGHLAAASGLALIIRTETLPLSSELLRQEGSREACLPHALYGGEDYELCLVAPPGVLAPLTAPFREAFGIPLTRIGLVASGEGVRFEGEAAPEGPPRGGFDHFAGEECG